MDPKPNPSAANRRLLVAVFSVLMLVCATASNAVMDTLSFRFSSSVFAAFPASRGWLDPQVSWHNKWKDGERSHGEAFPLSSTALVPLTDAWHLAKSVTIFCLILAVVAPFTLVFELRWPWWLGVIFGLQLIYGLVFEGLFAHLLICVP